METKLGLDSVCFFDLFLSRASETKNSCKFLFLCVCVLPDRTVLRFSLQQRGGRVDTNTGTLARLARSSCLGVLPYIKPVATVSAPSKAIRSEYQVPVSAYIREKIVVLD